MKQIHTEYFNDYKKSGCKIEQITYDFNDEHDCFALTFVISPFTCNDTAFSDRPNKIELTMFSPSDIFMKSIENNSQICELEMLDFSDSGYSSECRYRLHDIEDEQINVYFKDYILKTSGIFV